MLRTFKSLCAVVALALVLSTFSSRASAQYPVAVASYYPVRPAVTYVPTRGGLFGRRLVYRRAVTYVAPAVATGVTTYYAPAAPATVYYAPAPVAAYYRPSVLPVVIYWRP